MKIILLAGLLLFSTAFAQEQTDNSSAKSGNSIKVNGYIKNWFEANTSTGDKDFLVRMARLGVKGNINMYAGYKVMVDFTRLGKLQTSTTTIEGKNVVSSASASFSDYLLDAEAFINPVKSLSLSLGQFKVPFSSDNLKSGADIDFINRPLTTNTAPALRDIGFMVSYVPAVEIPMEIKGGVFNGAGQNKPENDKNLNYSLRGVVHPVKNLGLSANYYTGKSAGANTNMFNLGADFSFEKVYVSGEYGQKINKLSAKDVTSNALFVYSLYDFDFQKSMISHLIPALRYEHYKPDNSTSKDEVNKITAGLSFEFAKLTYAQFRVNYEILKYENGSANLQKLILELQIRY
ncbi:MAG TPA: porin [Ignavibacteriales bacterium]|nr:porin [Ignavibacteriales bacterium]